MNNARAYIERYKPTASQHIDNVVSYWKRSCYLEDPSVKRMVVNEVRRELKLTHRQAKELIERH